MTIEVETLFDGGATNWDGGATRFDYLSADTITSWDSGTTTWDLGVTLFDIGYIFEATTDSLVFTEFDAIIERFVIHATTDSMSISSFNGLVVRPPIVPDTVALTATTGTASVTRPAIGIINTPSITSSVFAAHVGRTINVVTASMSIVEFIADVDHPQEIQVPNLESIVLTKYNGNIAITTRNLTFYLSPVF
jgi:hypothetical protein